MGRWGRETARALVGPATVVLSGVALAMLSGAAAAGPEPFPVPGIPWAPRQYVCYRAAQAPAIDGRIDERAWTQAPWTEPFTDIQGPLAPAPRYRTRARMLWDERCLYVAAHLEEPQVWGTLVERDAVIYHDNDFEVFIDPDGDTHEYYELEINALGTVWDLLLIKPYRDGGPAINAWDIAGLATAVQVDGTLNDPSDTDAGWSVEIAMPWRVLAECAHRPAPPTAGDQWRLNFSRVEWPTRVEAGRYVKCTDPETEKPLPEDNWVWSPQGLIAMHYPEMWGYVQFSDLVAGGETAPQEAFRPDPWGAARAELQRVYYAQRDYWNRTGTFATSAAALRRATAGNAVSSAVEIYATPELFEARIACPDGAWLHVRQDGRIW